MVKKKCKFNAEKRGTKIKKFEFNNRVEGTDTHYYKLNDNNLFDFRVDKPIIFHGFEMCGRTPVELEKQNPESFIIKLTDNNALVLLESKIEILFDGIDKTYELLFDKSMLLKPNITYKVKIKRLIPDSFQQYFRTGIITKKEFEGVFFDIHCNFYCCQSIIFSNDN